MDLRDSDVLSDTDNPIPPSNKVSMSMDTSIEEDETDIEEDENTIEVPIENIKPPKEKVPIVPVRTGHPNLELSYKSNSRSCSMGNPRLLFSAIISVIMLLCGLILLVVPGVTDKGINTGIIMCSSVVGLWSGALLEPLNTKPKK